MLKNIATNLMHINSPSMATLDTVSEYQRVFINDAIGEIDKNLFKAKRTKTLKLKLESLEYIWNILEVEFNTYNISKYKAVIIEEEFVASLDWYYDSTHTGVVVNLSSSSVNGCWHYIQDIENYLLEYIIKAKSVSYTILQHENGELQETNYQDVIDVAFNPLAVPFIEDVDAYIEAFLDAKAPVLILQGAAGTGKTTFVKQILKTMQNKILNKRDELQVTYSFDENVFYSSEFYKQLIFDDYDVQVYEDINQVLYKNQEDELDPINKFLSVTDGLISKYKKIIITTNIESKSQLNPALLRPGRCFDVLEFRNLEGVEIDNLCDSCAKELTLQTESISLSEFFAKKDGMKHSSMISNRVGF